MYIALSKFINSIKLYQYAILTALLLPASFVFADPPGTAAAESFVKTLNKVILFPLIALLSGIAFLMFLVGCAQYIFGANNPQAREQGVKHITYGVIGLVIMLSAWAILNLVAGTFGIDPPEPPEIDP